MSALEENDGGPPVEEVARSEQEAAKENEKKSRARTVDVVSSSKSFADLMVPGALAASLAAAGFTTPSPVQQSAIPLGRLGTDLIVQAKSGTGKTVTFAVIVLERINMEVSAPQALILAPTREIAIQSEQVINRIIAGMPDGAPRPACTVFVGGLNIVADEKRLRRLVHVAVGTPGRVCSLLQSGALPTKALSMFVLDEADTLLGDSFYADVTWVYDQLGKRKQIMAFSATYTPELLADLEPLMKRPQRVMLCAETVSLQGVAQFYVLVDGPEACAAGGAGSSAGVPPPPPPAADAKCRAGRAAGGGASSGAEAPSDAAVAATFSAKADALLALLHALSFHQAAVFCNHKPQAEWLAQRLTADGFPAAYLSGDRPQEERMQAMDSVRGFKLRVVVSTDVMARGVDLDRVNVVANLDVPYDAATYVHRVGRTGRFGSLGIAVSYVTAPELESLRGFLAEAQAGEVRLLPETIPADMYSFELGSEWEREALDSLKAAPKGAPPARLPPASRKLAKDDAAAQDAEEGSVEAGGRAAAGTAGGGAAGGSAAPHAGCNTCNTERNTGNTGNTGCNSWPDEYNGVDPNAYDAWYFDEATGAWLYNEPWAAYQAAHGVAQQPAQQLQQPQQPAQQPSSSSGGAAAAAAYPTPGSPTTGDHDYHHQHHQHHGSDGASARLPPPTHHFHAPYHAAWDAEAAHHPHHPLHGHPHGHHPHGHAWGAPPHHPAPSTPYFDPYRPGPPHFSQSTHSPVDLYHPGPPHYPTPSTHPLGGHYYDPYHPGPRAPYDPAPSVSGAGSAGTVSDAHERYRQAYQEYCDGASVGQHAGGGGGGGGGAPAGAPSRGSAGAGWVLVGEHHQAEAGGGRGVDPVADPVADDDEEEEHLRMGVLDGAPLGAAGGSACGGSGSGGRGAEDADDDDDDDDDVPASEDFEGHAAGLIEGLRLGPRGLAEDAGGEGGGGGGAAGVGASSSSAAPPPPPPPHHPHGAVGGGYQDNHHGHAHHAHPPPPPHGPPHTHHHPGPPHHPPPPPPPHHHHHHHPSQPHTWMGPPPHGYPHGHPLPPGAHWHPPPHHHHHAAPHHPPGCAACAPPPCAHYGAPHNCHHHHDPQLSALSGFYREYSAWAAGFDAWRAQYAEWHARASAGM